MTRRGFIAGCLAFAAAVSTGIATETSRKVLTRQEYESIYDQIRREVMERIAEDIERAFFLGASDPARS